MTTDLRKMADTYEARWLKSLNHVAAASARAELDEMLTRVRSEALEDAARICAEGESHGSATRIRALNSKRAAGR